MSRPVWECQRDAGCCRLVKGVVMTLAEREQLIQHPASAGRRLEWSNVERGFVVLKAAPCPMLEGTRCTVYEVRPYNCRRTACFRPDPKREPLMLSNGLMGFHSADRRMATDRRFMRLAIALQHRAKTWARRMGWPDDESR